MNINSRNIYIVYLVLYFSLLVGFYFNEDFAAGYKIDYFYHKDRVVNLFGQSFIESFLNFDKLGDSGTLTAHSPVYIAFFLLLQKISFTENFSRLIGLHLSLLMPLFFYLCLKLKYEFQNNDIKILLPTIIFISPYFRSASIWLGSENISLIFLIICFYFFLKHENSKTKELSYIFLTTLFLALAAYIRPIYSIFSIYFFVRFYFDLNFSPKLLFYIFVNLLLSLPAIYYVFVLGINFFSTHIFKGIELSDFVNQISITITLLFFYSIPFLLVNFKKNFRTNNIKIINLFFSIIILFVLIFFFDYNLPYGGGIFYKLSFLIFENNFLFYLFVLISLNALILIFFPSFKKREGISDLILLLVLIFLEIDAIFYHETYDPLLYFIYFLLIKNRFYISFAKEITNHKFIVLVLFSTSFYILSILKTIT